MKIRNYGNE